MNCVLYLQRQRSHRLRAVSASSAELKRPQMPKNLNRPVRPDPESEKPEKASEPDAKAPSTEQAATPEEPEQTRSGTSAKAQQVAGLAHGSCSLHTKTWKTCAMSFC